MNRTFKSFALFLSIFTLSLLFCGCSDNGEELQSNNEENKSDGIDSPKTEEFETGSITYQFNDNVTVLDESSRLYLVRTEADTVLYISKSIPADQKPYVGKIISSGIIDEKTPYGLGNKVLSVSEEDGLYKCITTSASLEEIFKELSLSADIQLITDTISNPIEDINGNMCEVKATEENNARASIGSPNIVTINMQKGDKIYVDASISLGAVATINIDLKKNKHEVSLSLYSGINGEIGGEATYWEKDFYKLAPKKGKWKIATGVVSIGPVILRPYIDAELGIEGSIKGKISTGLSKHFGFQCGIKDGKGFSKNLTTNAENIIDKFSADVIGEIGPVIKIDFGIGLYTKNVAAGITNSLKAILSTDFQLNNIELFSKSPELEFNIVADADAFLVAQFFGKEFVHEQEEFASINIFSTEWPLLPKLKENSLKISKRTNLTRTIDDEPLIFNAEYELTGGLLNVDDIASESLSMKPSFRVYNEEEKEVYHLVCDEQKITGTEKQKFSFELTGLEQDVTYKGVPCLSIAGKIYEEAGKDFSALCTNESHPHFIDLGLPSGTLWCCMNAGGTEPTDFGRYYLMSEAKNISNIMGDGYSAPSREQFEELLAHTTQSRKVFRNVKGILFQAPNGNAIFMPAAAQLWWNAGIWDINNAGSGAYWTISQSNYEDYYYFLEFNDKENVPFFSDRNGNTNKLPVRVVYKKQ